MSTTNIKRTNKTKLHLRKIQDENNIAYYSHRSSFRPILNPSVFHDNQNFGFAEQKHQISSNLNIKSIDMEKNSKNLVSCTPVEYVKDSDQFRPKNDANKR